MKILCLIVCLVVCASLYGGETVEELTFVFAGSPTQLELQKKILEIEKGAVMKHREIRKIFPALLQGPVLIASDGEASNYLWELDEETRVVFDVYNATDVVTHISFYIRVDELEGVVGEDKFITVPLQWTKHAGVMYFFCKDLRDNVNGVVDWDAAESEPEE